MSDTAYVVMSDPPELRASHPKQVWETKEAAEEAADEISFGYVIEVEKYAE